MRTISPQTVFLYATTQLLPPSAFSALTQVGFFSDNNNATINARTTLGTTTRVLPGDPLLSNHQDGLIHIPLRTRASVLKERNLVEHEIVDEDAASLYSRFEEQWNRSLQRISDGGDIQQRAFAGEGTHFIDVYVGSPAQRRVLAVSSGADFTAFPCQECTKCGNIMSFFQHDLSSSYGVMPCGQCVGGQKEDVCDSNRERCIARGFNLVDKSAWEAYEARDFVFIGGTDLGNLSPIGTDVPKQYGFPLVFGCQTEVTGWYASQVQDGIIGFSTARTSFVNQMVFQNKLELPRFSMCFEQKILMGSDLRSAGMITLGGYNPRILDAPMVYVQNVAEQGDTRYKVYIRSIYFREGGGQSIVPDRDGQAIVKLDFDADTFNAKNGGTILDSAVPWLVFDESIEETFKAEWRKMVGEDFSLGKLMLTERDVRQLPTLILQIKAHGGIDKSFDPRTVPNMAGDRDPKNPHDAFMAIPALHYMEFNPITGTYRAKLTLDSKLGSFLGINGMQGHAFVYDLREDRIGFAESYDCKPKINGLAADDDMFDTTLIDIDTLTAPVEDPSNPTDNDPLGQNLGDGVAPTKPAPKRKEYFGSCRTATCISFVTVGYVFVVAIFAVAYKMHRPKDRSKHWDQETGDDDELYDDFAGESEVLNPEFEQHIRHGHLDRFV